MSRKGSNRKPTFTKIAMLIPQKDLEDLWIWWVNGRELCWNWSGMICCFLYRHTFFCTWFIFSSYESIQIAQMAWQRQRKCLKSFVSIVKSKLNNILLISNRDFKSVPISCFQKWPKDGASGALCSNVRTGPVECGCLWSKTTELSWELLVWVPLIMEAGAQFFQNV